MAKPKNGPDTSFVLYRPAPEEYTFIPKQHLHGHYTVGVNCDAPVYFPDGPTHRREQQHRDMYAAFKARVDAGEHLYPLHQPHQARYSFAISERNKFSFGDVSINRVPRELPAGEIPVKHLYDPWADFHPDDGIDVVLRGDAATFYPVGLLL